MQLSVLNDGVSKVLPSVSTFSVGLWRRRKKFFGRGGIRTHAIEMTGALNQRLRPLGHPTS